VRAVRLQPSNPTTWLQLGEFDLSEHRSQEALAVLRAALYLGPHDPETLSAIAQARAASGVAP
jgi:cytochrome c-type biogenesis protein CcmH/NrfG